MGRRSARFVRDRHGTTRLGRNHPLQSVTCRGCHAPTGPAVPSPLCPRIFGPTAAREHVLPVQVPGRRPELPPQCGGQLCETKTFTDILAVHRGHKRKLLLKPIDQSVRRSRDPILAALAGTYPDRPAIEIKVAYS